MNRSTIAPLLLSTLVTCMAGCASTPGAMPHDMSAAGHESHAALDEQAATAHAKAYDPKARKAALRCAPTHGDVANDPCWTSERNPTADHLDAAERYEKMAADHRAAAQTLRDAEARSCTGIAEADRDVSPFYHREDIERVDVLQENVAAGRSTSTVESGAVVYFRAVPGLTKELFQHIVNCHLARNAVMGHDMPEMSYCPLAPKGVSAEVRSDGDRFAVAIRSNDADVRSEVLRRARALVSAAPDSK